MRYGSKWPTYAEQWDEMVINSSRSAEFTKYAQFAIANKARYLEIERATGVTWPHIAVLHRRESDADFDTYLGNGQSLNQVTTIVPKGRGPFSSFTEGAIDALRHDGLDKVIDWRLEKILYYCETFNGLGYENKGLPSPYIWGGTNQQRSGKYVSDGVFDANAMDTQPGCAPILQMIAQLDPTVKFVRETPMGVEPETLPMPDVQVIPPGVRPDLRPLIEALLPLIPAIVAAIQAAKAGEPIPPLLPPPVVQPPPPLVTTTPAIQRPSVQLGVFGVVASAVLQALGVVGTPLDFGTNPTTLGTAATVIPAAIAATGLTGVWGTLANVGLNLAASLLKNRIQQRNPQ